jgi:hypothetical protein
VCELAGYPQSDVYGVQTGVGFFNAFCGASQENLVGRPSLADDEAAIETCGSVLKVLGVSDNE